MKESWWSANNVLSFSKSGNHSLAQPTRGCVAHLGICGHIKQIIHMYSWQNCAVVMVMCS